MAAYAISAVNDLPIAFKTLSAITEPNITNLVQSMSEEDAELPEDNFPSYFDYDLRRRRIANKF